MSSSKQHNTKKKMVTAFFEEWQPRSEVDKGILLGQVVTGILRINGRKCTEAFVKSDRCLRDIFIDGEKNRNRALNGDVVAIELFDKSRWKPVDATKAVSAGLASLNLFNSTSPAVRSVDVELWDPLIEKNSLAAKQKTDTESNLRTDFLDSGNFQAAGKVIRVLAANEGAGMNSERFEALTHIGVLVPSYGFDRERNPLVIGKPLPASDSFVEFRPLDSRIPFLMVPRFQAPQDFAADPLSFAPPNQRLFEATITSWNPEHRFPKAKIVRMVGESGLIGPETEALLIETNCDHGEFPDDAMQTLRETVGENGWTIPDEEIQARKDIRDWCVFTIDPSTAKDLDDALSCVRVPGGKVKGRDGQMLPPHFEIGVHIADVSYFLDPETPLDSEAQRRSTTVYLVNKVVPMLPPLLCEELCSLNEGVDRLAYSCIWRMTSEGDMLPNSPPAWFGRTVIRSCARLDYGTAQKILDGTVTSESGDTGNLDDANCWPKSRQPEQPHSKQSVIDDVCNLGRIAMKRREKRFQEGGALALTAVKMSFDIDRTTGNPVDVKAYPIHDSNRTIEEYMLMANFLVAQKLIMGAGKKAFIRHHPPPDAKQMMDIVTIMAKHGVEIDSNAVSSAHGLHHTLERLKNTISPLLLGIVFNLLKKPLKPAKYHTAGNLEQYEWRHWALNIPYYTHFTSPIRRYADVMVHRLLTSVLDETMDDFPDSLERIQEIADHCNEKKETSKEASYASDKVFFCILIKQKFESGQPIEASAVVQEVGPNSFTLLLMDYGVDVRVHVERDWKASEFVANFVKKEHPKQDGDSKPKGNPNSKQKGDSKPKQNSKQHGDSKPKGDSKTKGNPNFKGRKKEKDPAVESLEMTLESYGTHDKVRVKIEPLVPVTVILEPSIVAQARISFITRFVSIGAPLK